MSQRPASLDDINSASVAVVLIIAVAIGLISIVAHEFKQTKPPWVEKLWVDPMTNCVPAILQSKGTASWPDSPNVLAAPGSTQRS